MKERCFQEFFKKSPIAYSCHRAIFDNEGIPYDYEYLLLNEAFEDLLKIQGTDLINKTFYQVFPEGWEGEEQWKELVQNAVVDYTSAQFDIYRESIQKWIRVLVFPLCYELIGCIYHDVTTEYALNKETQKLEMELFRNNRSLLELTKKLEKKNRILNDLAIKDELTGLYNRHFLDQWIEKEMSRADRDHQPLSMIIFDLDHFKRVNDVWGHPVGDEVLKETANLANSLICDPDFLVRLGGEEFVIIMPGSSIQRALAVAETIRQTLEKYKYPIIGHLTASFGVAERMELESYYSWYKRSDKAMYRAKEGGRNRVYRSEDQDRLLNAPINIKWKAEWESGNHMIDEQHRELVESANSLLYLFLAESEKGKIMPAVDKVLDRIIKHFQDEEQILVETGYPDYENHAEIHKALLGKVFQFKKSYQAGDLKLAELFSFIVNDLIIGHIQNADTEFFPYTQNTQTKALELNNASY
ncbi:bacteriohemerythrin [Schinkia azotoformans]|uniref:bacteriohemerythrin n=1 Tax=Schinkia azotoformans TaxID=1454 RepID=UPI002DB658FB|nr:bacteriohemerythrin [Schinkia azotoformans]MEC1716117.1 bacteriohemerythrin [Schinkia azotoformans]MEC1740588.1 bacteriohemerythrin [Schinkia azotoformans]MEC1756156.1 bacteriohemerythrin [Schinkia azotoformans]MEC1768807.1 bacteriohemerythrin [Schinkia azotoformans]MEC1788363.1 bacteriohemerythrin [Schinkia azotoformans]